ncbi:MAG: zwf, partial [Rhodospirillales bacterium]|nr:zwf [Rhodospirillales bacterium]
MAAIFKTGRQADPCTMVIFGASGDLTKRLLVPALYNLKHAGLLPDGFRLIGVARSEHPNEAFREDFTKAIKDFATGAVAMEEWDDLVSRVSYQSGAFDDPETYQKLLDDLISAGGGPDAIGNCLFYLATAPEFFATIVERLAAAGLTREEGDTWRRVIIEKPFGHDLESARSLNTELQAVLAERQIYRIDHYLGKETVQNIMVFRFANGIFEPLWNRDHIDHVQITVAETVGVEARGGFYEQTGALRDMIPNHMFQLLSFIAMEAPTSFAADALRSEKVKVLDSIRPLDAGSVLTDAVRGQYGAGVLNEKPVWAYRAEPKIAADSMTETYAALKLNIDNWRWAGVPFYLRTGKRLPRRMSEIAIQFKRAPIAVFRDTPVEDVGSNLLVIRIQPDEGVSLQFGAKIPGTALDIGNVKMNFQYKDYFQSAPSTGYETLIYDAMIGDATLFQRADNVEAGWKVVQPVLEAWASRRPRDFPNYEAGTQGPRQADELLARDG